MPPKNKNKKKSRYSNQILELLKNQQTNMTRASNVGATYPYRRASALAPESTTKTKRKSRSSIGSNSSGQSENNSGRAAGDDLDEMNNKDLRNMARQQMGIKVNSKMTTNNIRDRIRNERNLSSKKGDAVKMKRRNLPSLESIKQKLQQSFKELNTNISPQERLQKKNIKYSYIGKDVYRRYLNNLQLPEHFLVPEHDHHHHLGIGMGTAEGNTTAFIAFRGQIRLVCKNLDTGEETVFDNTVSIDREKMFISSLGTSKKHFLGNLTDSDNKIRKNLIKLLKNFGWVISDESLEAFGNYIKILKYRDDSVKNQFSKKSAKGNKRKKQSKKGKKQSKKGKK